MVRSLDWKAVENRRGRVEFPSLKKKKKKLIHPEQFIDMFSVGHIFPMSVFSLVVE